MIDAAISAAESRIAAYGQGTSKEPADGSLDYFTLRAEVLGLAYLRQVKVRGIAGRPAECEALYRVTLGYIKGAAA